MIINGNVNVQEQKTKQEIENVNSSLANLSAGLASALKISCGSYVGTGLTGEKNKWSLTCPGKLIAFRIYATTNANYTGSNATLNDKQGTSTHGYLIFTTHELSSLKDYDANGYKYVNNTNYFGGEGIYLKMLDDSTISMYGTMTNAENIFNYINTKYFYMMFYE